MYDVHCHILPAFDDGAKSLDEALQMARIALDDGITHLACTPHIYPGLYDYDTQQIQQAVETFRAELEQAGIPLVITMGADIQLVSEMLERLKDGSMPTINRSRYLLFEPPHHVAPSKFEEAVFNIIASDYVPVITHPERLSWLENHYQEFINITRQGAWMQVTAGSLTGNFGKRPQYWAEKMLDDGIVHLLATDGHNLEGRAPILSQGKQVASKFVGEQEAQALVMERPRAVWDDIPVENVSRPPAFSTGELFTNRPGKQGGFLRRLFSR